MKAITETLRGKYNSKNKFRTTWSWENNSRLYHFIFVVSCWHGTQTSLNAKDVCGSTCYLGKHNNRNCLLNFLKLSSHHAWGFNVRCWGPPRVSHAVVMTTEFVPKLLVSIACIIHYWLLHLFSHQKIIFNFLSWWGRSFFICFDFEIC